MAGTTKQQTPGTAGARTPSASTGMEQERRTVLLQPEYADDAEALLRALIAIARRLANERQTLVQSAEAGELVA